MQDGEDDDHDDVDFKMGDIAKLSYKSKNKDKMGGGRTKASYNPADKYYLLYFLWFNLSCEKIFKHSIIYAVMVENYAVEQLILYYIQCKVWDMEWTVKKKSFSVCKDMLTNPLVSAVHCTKRSVCFRINIKCF